MNRYICKNVDELNFCIEKYKLEFVKHVLSNIYACLEKYNIISLNDQEFSTTYCHSYCHGCGNTNCKSKPNILINIRKIMREEKLNRILND